MKAIKQILKLITISIITISFSNCSSVKKMQDKAPFSFDEVYYQHWVAGVRGGGSGVNVFISLKSNPDNIELDSIYFRGQQSKVEISNEKLIIGRFLTKANQKEDIIMSSEPHAEYGNKAPELPKNTPFSLKDDECVISYKQGETTKYYKISNMLRKPSPHYPSAPPNKQ